MRTGDDRLPLLCRRCGNPVGWWVADKEPMRGDIGRLIDLRSLDGGPVPSQAVMTCKLCGCRQQPIRTISTPDGPRPLRTRLDEQPQLRPSLWSRIVASLARAGR
jgi:hypothetical protein